MGTKVTGGLGIAIATPFKEDQSALFGSGEIDYPAYEGLLKFVCENGADFIVVLGSTGEASTLSMAERELLIKKTVEYAAGKFPVVVGVTHNSTAETVSLARHAKEHGATHLLIANPYYNKPQASGVFAHYLAVAKATGLPIIAYNVPSRTGQNISAKDLHELWKIDEVIAIKESSGNLTQIGEIAQALPKGKILFSGDDNLGLPSMALGAQGLISVIGNIKPKETKALVSAALAGDFTTARTLHHALLPLMQALFIETNPAPLKAALAQMGYGSPAVRLPIIPASDQTKSMLQKLL